MKTLALRVVLLTALLFGLNAWTFTHLGAGLQDFALVNGILGFFAIVLGWIDERDAGSLRASIKGILTRAVEGPVLLALYVAALIGTSLVSSVTVIADGHGGSTTLHLTAEGSERCGSCAGESLDGPGGVVRYVRFTNPFGRSFFLEASGYQRKSVALFPWTGTKISLARDLVQLPTIVVRIPPQLHTSLAGGKVVVEFGPPHGPGEIPTQAGRASIQLGPAAAITDVLRREWRSELRALSTVQDDTREKFFRSWLNPIRDEALPLPVPGQRLPIRFLTQADRDVGGYELVVGRGALQDVALIPGS